MSARRAPEGSGFGRSAGGAAARGTALIAVAVLIGLFLLNENDQPAPFSNVTSDGTAVATTTTTAPGVTATTAPALRPKGQVKVLVANGSTVAGAGSKMSNRLQVAGYNTLSATNTKQPATAAAIYYAAGYAADAKALATSLGLGAAAVQPMPTPLPINSADLRGAHVLVILDAALAQRA